MTLHLYSFLKRSFCKPELMVILACLTFANTGKASGDLTVSMYYSTKYGRALPKVGLYVREQIARKLFYTSWSGFGGSGSAALQADRFVADNSWYVSEHALNTPITPYCVGSVGPHFTYVPYLEEPLIISYFAKLTWKF